MKPERFLVDVNVALALLHPRHAHAKAAQAWLQNQNATGSVLLCRVVQMGALRLLTKPIVMREDVMDSEEFWHGWDAAMADERLELVNEPVGLESEWRKASDSLPAGTSIETDVYLAAFAIAGSYRLVSFDKGFSRFQGLNFELIQPF